MSITDRIDSSTELLKPLTDLMNKDCHPVGAIYHLDYDSAVVLTDDYKKEEAGGVPRSAFLLAAAGENTPHGFLLEEQEVVLLRVRGTAALPNESELIQTRLAVIRDAGDSNVGFNDVTDPKTRLELEQSAFDCEVLGTFYTEEDKQGAVVSFGADIDNVMASARYQVFLSSAQVLSWLASYPEPDKEDDTLSIGVVRFSATRRKAVLANTHQAAVRVHVADFVGRKTAIFGMTRTGKSNTIKTLVTSVHRYASEKQRSIGQLIFDPQGEYANVNKQDETGLKLLGDNDSTVRIYKINPGHDSREKNLRFNFFDLSIVDAVWSIVLDSVKDMSTNYGKEFRSVELSKPEASDRSATSRWEWSLVAFYGLLDLCGYSGAAFAGRQKLHVTLKGESAKSFLDEHPGAITSTSRAGDYYVESPANARLLAEWVNGRPEEFPKWHENSCHFKNIFNAYKFTGVTSNIKTIRDFHSADTAGDVGEHLWEDMKNGRLAIVDLSTGNATVAKVMSERIVTHLLNEANQRFRGGVGPIAFQIVVEEAHNLFERGGGRQVAEDPWVRLSKEAAKYEIGLMYATQEVTSVDKRILSNTSNWLIAHLNSDHETKELSHYYDFSVWAPSLTRVDDVGFVRMKTYSGKYVVPVQVAKFDHAMINGARIAAGLDKLDFAVDSGR